MKLKPVTISKEEFAARWEESRSKLYCFAYCYVKNEHDALEILSEATYRAYCGLEKLQNPDFFHTWMCKIVMNAAIDFLKKKNRFVPLDMENQESTNVGVWDQVESRIDMFQALDHIVPEDRAFIILKYLEEKSFKEIAEMMGIPEATVKTRVYRTLEKLRYLLESKEASL